MIRTAVALIVIVAAIAVGLVLWNILAVDVRLTPSHEPSAVEEPTPSEPPTEAPEPSTGNEPAPVGLEVDVRRNGNVVTDDVDLHIVVGTDRASAQEGPFRGKRLPDQPAGRYVIVAASGGDVGASTVFELAAKESRRVRIDLRAGATVSGRVTASRRGVKGATVSAPAGQFDLVTDSGAKGPLAEELAVLIASLVGAVKSASEGRFELRGVPTGDVTLAGEALAGRGEASVRVKAPRTSDVEIVLLSEAIVHGTARFWTGDLIVGGSFELRPASGEPVSFSTDQDGNFRIESLKPETYTLVHHVESTSYVVPHATVDVRAGEDVEFNFSAGLVLVEGQVTREGKPMGGVQIVFFDDVERLSTLTDVDGRYTLEVHRAGEYSVQLASEEPFRTLVANDARCTLDFTMRP